MSTWTLSAIEELFTQPWLALMQRAAAVHQAHWPTPDVELATLLSVKTGGCPENCGYCPQSQSFDTGLHASKLLPEDEVLHAAKAAKAAGATRFCMGAAWRSPKERDLEKMAHIIASVKALGLETCATLGMLSSEQAQTLQAAGLDYYNHNLDTSPAHYAQVVTTRTYQDRIDTIAAVREAGIKVCCGGIIGLGEEQADRASLIAELVKLQPESVPVNSLVPVPGTVLASSAPVDPLDFLRVIAVCRITMPKARIRLSAGRQQLGEAVQALCFLAGANSIFYGDKLLTTGNPDTRADDQLLEKLGLRTVAPQAQAQATPPAGCGCGTPTAQPVLA